MPDGVGVANDIVTEDDGLSGGRREERGEDAQGGGLAGAVGADESEQVTLVDGEVEVGQGDHRAVGAGETRGLNSRKRRSGGHGMIQLKMLDSPFRSRRGTGNCDGCDWAKIYSAA